MNIPISKQFFIFLCILLLGLSAGVGLYYVTNVHGTSSLSEQDMKAATLLKQPRTLKSFSLKDMHNKPFTPETLKGHWNLVFFGFTHCPSICPTSLATLNRVYQTLEKSGLKKLPRVIFVSVDPEKDQPKVLQTYLSHFNPHFLGVTGDKKQINILAKDLGAVYMEVKAENSEEYTIDHSAAVFVVDPKGNFYALFSAPEKEEDMVMDLKKMLR